MVHRLRCSGIIACFIFVTSIAFAKGSPELVVISGGGLKQAVEINDPAKLKQFGPFGELADFQKQSLIDVPCSSRSFQVFFYMKWPGRKSRLDRGDLKMVYAARYCSTESSGYVYLPGPGEPNYPNNASTIYRPDYDGKWFPAAPAWDSLMRNAAK